VIEHKVILNGNHPTIKDERVQKSSQWYANSDHQYSSSTSQFID